MNFKSRAARLKLPIADQAVVSGSNFLVGILLVRALGVEGYGVYVLLWSITQFMQACATALLNAPMATIGPAQGGSEADTYYGSVGTLTLLWALFTGGLVLLIGSVSTALPAWWRAEYAVPLACWQATAQVQEFARRVAYARGAHVRVLAIDAVGYLPQIAVAAIFASAGVVPAIWWISSCLGASAAFAWFTEVRFPFDAAQAFSTIRRHWISSRWLLGAAWLQWISSNLLILGAASTMGAVIAGAIRATQNIFGFVNIAFNVVESVTPAAASRRMAAGGVRALGAFVVSRAVLLAVITLACGLILALGSREILTIFYGAAGPEATHAAIWFVPIYTLTAVGLVLRIGLRTMERTRAIFVGYVASTCASIATTHWLQTQLEPNIHFVLAALLLTQLVALSPVMMGFRQLIKRGEG